MKQIQLIIFLLCSIAAQGQGVTPFGATRAQDTSKTKGQLVVTPLANSASNKVMTTTSTGQFVLVDGFMIDSTNMLKKTDTSRSGIVTTYWYVDSLHARTLKKTDTARNGIVATNFFVDSLFGAFSSPVDTAVLATNYRVDTAKANIRTATRTNNVIGTIYNADAWVNLDTFSSNFAGYSIDGDSNIAFTSGSTSLSRVVSLDRHTNLDRWSMSAKVIIGAKTSTSYGFGLGLFGVGDVSTADFYVYFNMTSHATQSGKLYMQMGVAVRDSSITGLPFINGDTVQLDFVYNYDDLKYTAKVYNFRSDSSVTSTFSGGELSSQGLTTAFALPGISKFSVFSRSGDWVLDSFAISSNTIKNPDIVLIGDSKGQGASVFDMFYSYPKRLMRVYPNIVQLSGQGNSVGDLERLLPEIKEVSGKIILANIGYNSFANGVNSDTINAQYSRVIAGAETDSSRFISLLPQYDNMNQTTLRNWIIANRTPDQYIDAYAATLALGSAGLYDGVHPNDTGSAVIANEILKSGKLDGLMLTDYNRHDNIRDDAYFTNIYEPVKITGRKETGLTGPQRVANFVNPNSGTTDGVAIAFSPSNNPAFPRGEITVSSNTAVGYRQMAFNLFSTSLTEVARFRTDWMGMSIGLDSSQGMVISNKPALGLGRPLGVFTPNGRGNKDSVFIIGSYEDHDTRNHVLEAVNSTTSTDNRIGWRLSNSGNFGATTGIWHRVITGGFDGLGIGTETPSEALHVNGNIQVSTLKIITGSGDPEGSVTAPQGSIYMRTGGGAGSSFYVKESGSGNTGWVGK